MGSTQINGATQIRTATITSTQLASNAGITDGQLAVTYIKADGTRAFTGTVSMGSNQITNVAAPSSSTDAATKGYVDGVAQGLANKYSADAAVYTETLTIASGSVTQISGTSADGVSPGVGEYVLILNAPAASGAAGGATLSTQPANGLYQVTNNTTNLTVTRAVDMSGSNGPFGSYVFVTAGTNWGGGGFVVTTPATPAAFTYGSGNIKFTQFSGAGEITVDATLVKTANQLARAAITGDVAIGSGSNSATISNAAVSLAKMANLAANSVIGNSTGSSATPTAVPMSTVLAASTIPMWDANSNLVANNLIQSMTATATAAGTTTLTIGSTYFQQFTGTTTQTCVLPNATTLQNGHSFTFANRSAGTVTVNMNGGSTLQAMLPGTQMTVTLISNATTAGTWDAAYTTAGNVVSAPGAGMVKTNGAILQTAVASVDYMAPNSFVVRETPTGTINGSNTSFTLANTPLSGTEMVFLNGLLQRAGSGNDYTISLGTITMLSAPGTGDFLSVTYQK